MISPTDGQVAEQLRALLLHQLPAQQTQQMEEKLLLDEDFAEQLRDAENDLLDDYAAERLSPSERVNAEKYVLASPSQISRVSVARVIALHRAPATRRSELVIAPGKQRAAARRWSLRWLAPLGGLIAASAAALMLWPLWHWVGRDVPDVPVPLPNGAAGRVIDNPGAPPAALARPPTVATLTNSIETLTLLAETQRGGAVRPLQLRSDARLVRLQLEVPGRTASQRFDIKVLDDTGRVLFTAKGLNARAVGPYRIVEAQLPRESLAPGKRQVALSTPLDAADSPVFVWRIDFSSP